MEKLKVLIGRSSQCDYTIENPEQHGAVSGKHATISEAETPDTFLFEDHSTNGSYVNGQLLHHSSILVKTSDYITLGKTYVLPLADIVKRYFSSSKTTKKASQPKPDSAQWTPVTIEEPSPSDNATRLIPQENNATQLISHSDNATRLLSQDDSGSDKVSEKIVEKVVEKVPEWYWGLLIASIVAAFIIGLCINC